MARALPSDASTPGKLVAQAFEKQASRSTPTAKGMSASKVAEQIGYEEVATCYTLTADGRRSELLYHKDEAHRADVPYSKLQAFMKGADGSTASGTGSGAGWG
eukprot:241845-Prymnesium_polylepis.1